MAAVAAFIGVVIGTMGTQDEPMDSTQVRRPTPASPQAPTTGQKAAPIPARAAAARVPEATPPTSPAPAPIVRIASFGSSVLEVRDIDAAGRTGVVGTGTAGSGQWSSVSRVHSGQFFLYRRDDGANRVGAVLPDARFSPGHTNPDAPTGFDHGVGLGQGLLFFYRSADGLSASHRYSDRMRLLDGDDYKTSARLRGYSHVVDVSANSVLLLQSEHRRSRCVADRRVRRFDRRRESTPPCAVVCGRTRPVGPRSRRRSERAGSGRARRRGQGIGAARVAPRRDVVDGNVAGDNTVLYSAASGDIAVLVVSSDQTRVLVRLSLPRGLSVVGLS